MSDDTSQELRIHIISDADTKGFQQTSQASKQIKVDTSDLSDATKRQLGLLPDLEQATEKSGEAAMESSISHRELRKVLDDIGNVAAPGAGRALSELAMGPIGAALAVVGAFELLKQKLDDDADAADKLGQLLGRPDTAGIKGLQDAWDQAQKSLADYYAKMQTAGEDDDPIATQIKRVKELTDTQVESSKKIVEALGKEEIARIRVTGEQTGKSKAEIDAAVAASESNTQATLAGLDQQKQAADGSAALIKEQQDRLAANGRLLDAAIAATRQAAPLADFDAVNAEAKRKAAWAALDPTTEAGKALIKQREDAAAALDNARELPTERVDPLSETVIDLRAVRDQAIADAVAQQAAVNAEINNQKKAANTDVFGITEQKRVADLERDRAQAASDHNVTRLRQLPGEITQAWQVEREQSFGQNAPDAVAAGQKAVVGNANAELTANVQDAVDQLQQSQAASRALFKAAQDAAAAHNDNAAALTQVFNDVRTSNLALLAKINQMQQQINAMPYSMR